MVPGVVKQISIYKHSVGATNDQVYKIGTTSSGSFYSNNNAVNSSVNQVFVFDVVIVASATSLNSAQGVAETEASNPAVEG